MFDEQIVDEDVSLRTTSSVNPNSNSSDHVAYRISGSNMSIDGLTYSQNLIVLCACTAPKLKRIYNNTPGDKIGNQFLGRDKQLSVVKIALIKDHPQKGEKHAKV